MSLVASAATLHLGSGCELDGLITSDLLDRDEVQAVPAHVHRLAADTLAQAAVAAWASGADAPPCAAQLALDLARASLGPIASVDLGPGTGRVLQLIADLPAAAARWQQRQAAADRTTDPARWARAVHEATWAAVLSGRSRPAAVVQLMAAATLARTDLTAQDLAGSVWNTASALLAATVVEDVLPGDAGEVLHQAGALLQ